MSLSDSVLKALVPRDKKYRVSVGDALFIIVYPNGGKYFVWVYRYPPGRSGQQRWHQIGPYGRGSGQWTLKAALEDWVRIRTWSKDTGRYPREMKKGSDQGPPRRWTTPYRGS